MAKPKSNDPTEHPTECQCELCKSWWASRGLSVPSTGVDEADPELEDGAEDEVSEQGA